MDVPTVGPAREPTGLELSDIQGIIRRGYENLKFARFVLLHSPEGARPGPWLGALVGDLRDATTKPGAQDSAIQVAFTYEGLVRLGVTQHIVENLGFPTPFEEGMARRLEILGDHDGSAPEGWAWGGPKNPEVHAVLMVYAGSDAALRTLIEQRREQSRTFGIQVLDVRLDGIELPGRKEHFGFRDGIAQPVIAGLTDTDMAEGERPIRERVFREGGAEDHVVAAGEFILGYRNVYGRFAPSPSVTASSDPERHLAAHPEGGRDVGRNGTFMVFRQLRQDVKAFWRYVDGAARANGTPSAAARERLAAEMVGRWRNGSPLVLSETGPDPATQDANDFGYFEDDRFGGKCPIGAHVRRANPRDSIDPNAESADPDPKGRAAVRLSIAGHRIIRRGRPYGAPSAETLDPQDLLDAPDPSEGVGLQFICLNADIARQFEFIQQTWLINPKFGGLYDEEDPLLGAAPAKAVERRLFGHFTVPEDPFRERLGGLQRFVHVEGGAYFFMPGIKAARYLAALGTKGGST